MKDVIAVLAVAAICYLLCLLWDIIILKREKYLLANLKETTNKTINSIAR